MDLIDHNSELFAEFKRHTNGALFEFPAWWATKVREASSQIGRATFFALPKADQHQLVLEHVRSVDAAAAIEP